MSDYIIPNILITIHFSFISGGRYMKRRLNFTAVIILLFLFLIPAINNSQTQFSADSAKGPKYKVESVLNMNGKKSAGLNDGIVVNVSHLSRFLKDTNGRQIILFVNWLPIVDCKSFTADTNRNELRFYLERTDSAKDAWDTILGEPTSFSKHVTVSVGTIGGSAIQCDKNNLELIIIRGWQFWVFVAYFILLILAIYLLFKKTNLLRDSYPPNTTDDFKKNNKTPYSLSRSQILFWTVIVLVSYIFIWLTTGDTNTVTGSTLILLAISSATALSARVIDTSSAAGTAPNAQTIQNANLSAESSAQQNLKPGSFEPSTGSFWRDIMGAKSQDSIHRLQIAAWTIVLGIIFISSVWAYMEMPEFNAQLLTLMGISSGTYIGLKYKEL